MTPPWRDSPILTGTDAALTHDGAISLQTARAMELARALGIRRPTRAQADRIVTVLAPCVPGLTILDAVGEITIEGVRWSPPRGGRPSWTDDQLGGLNWAVERIQAYAQAAGKPKSIKEAVTDLRNGLIKAGRGGQGLPSLRTFQNLLSIARRRGLWSPPPSAEPEAPGTAWGSVED